jgi:lysozyme
MKTSDQGRKLLIQREIVESVGVPLKAYRDSKGYWTIGIGHMDGVKAGDVITAAQAEDLFARDLARFEKAVNDCVKVPLKPNQFDALVSFSHNCGEAALAHGSNGGPSSILRALNAGDYAGAGRAFNNWMADPDVRTRRAGERDQFLGVAFEARRPV